MALRLRRGLDIDRQAVVFTEGEPVYVTDTKELYIGDGTTLGGVQISGILELSQDAVPRLGGQLDLDTHDIVGYGNIDIVGNINITGSFNAGFIEADYRGSLFALDSSVIIDGNNKTLHGSLIADDTSVLVDTSSKVFDLSETDLSSLKNVAVGGGVGDFLIYDGTTWNAQPFGTADGSTPIHTSLLQYDSAVGWSSATTLISTSSEVLLDLSTGKFTLSNKSLTDLSEVYIDDTLLTVDEVLTWDGVNWTHKPPRTQTTFLFELGDTNFQTDPIANDVLKFNGIVWESASLSLNDLESLTPVQGDSLLYDGVNWTASPISLNDLSDATVSAPVLNQALAYDGTSWVPSSLTIVNNINDVQITSVQPNDILSWDTVTAKWINKPYQGNVYAIDNSLLLDANAKSVNISTLSTNTFTATSGSLTETITFIGAGNEIVFQHPNPEDDNRRLGTLTFNDNTTTTSKVSATNNKILLEVDSTGSTFGSNSTVSVYFDGTSAKLGVGIVEATESLDVIGNGKFTGFVQFGSYTTVERDLLTITNGSVIYNTTVNKFQGYANNIWVDLH